MVLEVHFEVTVFFTNTQTLKFKSHPSQLRFLLLSVMITITSNEHSNTEKHKTDQNPPTTDHKP